MRVNQKEDHILSTIVFPYHSLFTIYNEKRPQGEQRSIMIILDSASYWCIMESSISLLYNLLMMGQFDG